MSQMQSLLIELGTEELPVKALPGLAQAFFDGTLDALNKRGIAVERGDAKPLYTPRRLAVLLPGVAIEQPEQHSEVLGPYLNIALNAEGQPTKALEGFAAKAGVAWTQLEKTSDAKGERFVHRAVKPGAKTIDLLPEILREAMAAMPIPKPMRWGDRDVGFARPVHWLVMLFGDAVVDGEVFGIRADRMSRGHRMMHEKPVWIGTPDVYIDALRAAKVLADPDERRARVVAEVESAAMRAGGSPRITEDNLEQVQCLVEWPKAVLCAFEREFLAVPQEALIATMEANQKFFPVLDGEGKLTEHFVGIANIESKDEAEVRKGYERVIRPRFADAKFFFDEDLKQGLDSMNDGLKTVTYQAKLGTVADKVARVAALAESIAAEVGVDPALAKRAAELAKADLQSRMVNEFPELQGIAGRYYAMHDASLNDLSADDRKQLADAIDEAYMPRFAGDAIAPSKLGQVLAIAERLDTLVGGFAAGLKPTGNKDPFSLRRNALGLARTVIESSIDLRMLGDEVRDGKLNEANPGAIFSAVMELGFTQASLNRRHKQEIANSAMRGGVELTQRLQEGFSPAIPNLKEDIFDFILDRLRAYYADQGVTPQQFEAVAALMRPIAPSGAPTKDSGVVVGGPEGPNAGETSAVVGWPEGPNTAAANSGSLLDFDRRLKAIGEFAKLPEAEALAAANKRIRNIVKKADVAIPDAPNPALYEFDAERDLHAAVEQAIADTDPLLASRDYVAALARLARLRPEVDDFFLKVFVNADDPAVRANRLALLQRLADRLGSVAAIEHLSV
ncbi:MAG: glycine--tRNA ligase subunit beta [Xanthomonadaceae bacterium]|nr:glycine--tRNA ligase subunit beta [Xanthomonadaceae bacterium]